ncbi:protocatechuate 3,4-dioxygenase [Aquabacterium sp. J223]|uniref:protocatechuate 3,4-dioxygenase n=1 Tax=Aquabacterium sp. J223 TaxID=2898431 RepID=UPI0021AE289A|nr:protocatechuate 3,4-dioxygenase [Aquabacterium sp. J223]UUX94516.1 protocatechuate 3,4-dioxygenase [Aquabacterium sp. J223]
MNPQLAGIEQVEGTYPFDLRTSVRALRLNRFFWRLALPEARQQLLGDPQAAFDAAGLTEEERALVTAQDWLGLVRYGVNFFVLEKYARVVRKSNLEVYALMRGESFEDFMKTRRVPEAR